MRGDLAQPESCNSYAGFREYLIEYGGAKSPHAQEGHVEICKRNSRVASLGAIFMQGFL